MNLKHTLTITYIALFLLSFSANSAEVANEIKACNSAVNKGDGVAGQQLAEDLLKSDKNNHEALICKARALGVQKKYPEAVKTYERAAQATQDSLSQIVTYILLGRLHVKNEDTTAAIASYTKSLEICAKSNNQTYSRINHNLIGDVHFSKKDFNTALDSYLVGVSLANNDNERAESFEKAAAAYNALGQHNKAVEFQVKATLMQEKSGTLTAYADAMLTLGQYHYDAKDYVNAERTNKKLVQFAKKNGGAYYEAKANYKLAEAMAANGDKSGAASIMTNALEQAKTIGAKQLVSEIEVAKKKLNI